MTSTNRDSIDNVSENQLDIDWHLSRHSKPVSSPSLDLSQYLELDQSSLPPQKVRLSHGMQTSLLIS